MSQYTKPSEQPGGVPSGFPARIREQDDPETRRSLIRENESALILARAGYNIEQNPSFPGTKDPDYQIEGKIFDCYAPRTANIRNIATNIKDKVQDEQTERIILNLDDSQVSLEQLRQQLKNYPIYGLLEIIVLKDENVINFFP